MDLIDTRTALDMRYWIDSLGGPYSTMAEAYNQEKPLGSLNNDFDVKNMDFVLKEHNKTVDELLGRLQKESQSEFK